MSSKLDEGKTMEKPVSGASFREGVAHFLKKEGYAVRDISSGSGVPKLSRLEIEKEGKKVTCAVKVTRYHQGRISFTRNPDGTYKVLSDSDCVIYACPAANDDVQAIISMFDGVTVKQAFDANFEARKGTDQEKLPMWLSPKLETGQRFIGSGFQDKALWSKVAPLLDQTSNSTPPTASEGDAAAVGIMERVKIMLSEHMGVRPDQLEVDVRVKL